MNLRALQCFIVLAEELNFSRAAERLHVAQPALSQQIRALEDRLGSQLVDRSSRPLRLTEAGNYFYTEARQILERVESATLGVRAIGFTRSAMYSVLPPALKAFHAAYPKVELKLFEMLTEEQADAFRDARIHVGIGRQAPPWPGCTTRTLLDERVMAVLASDHPLTARDVVRVDELADSPLIVYPKHPAAQFPGFIASLYRGCGRDAQRRARGLRNTDGNRARCRGTRHYVRGRIGRPAWARGCRVSPSHGTGRRADHLADSELSDRRPFTAPACISRMPSASRARRSRFRVRRFPRAISKNL